ncbi:prolipoprotein diacylglyceryl transferase [Algibacter lectus]|uniref:Phosphatidylglycerol--prolipoprotein diacylglyceryl transferase n=1 Tax=Algibacter lectus TaxID=221126 RepID=A0A090X6K4_9FLAO|nr:prolipoprotein diacylglyceryl transferase [Algibacter lectus]MDO7138400.1 prolipoprotein diacylglyceryl transferase [Algibacter lectus]MWW26516.1 prolipoprotein diacylglyceryl transferase [Algibacter lectus]TDY59790.1 prolipoprotein diacylglyceryl transferase [Algibacter lectus]SFD57548.1 prolipoprotein diacylglyceryl transferase [Algibacter lectus]GAL63884.1 prolipoprotein diacylglyceryl transferase [Algibacter lectus]
MQLLKFDWNPVTGIDIIGNFKIHFYSLMWVTAFVIGWYIMKRIFTKEKISLEYLDPLFIYTVLSTMIGARLGHVIFYQSELISQDFLSIFLPVKFKGGFEFTGFQGLASHGAAIGIIIGMYLYRRKYNYKSILWILDRIVIPVASGAIFIRIGNFINSEIIGKITDSSFGVRFIQDEYYKNEIMQRTGINDVQAAYNAVTNNPKFSSLLEAVPYRHPAQLYESFCYIFVFLILLYFYIKTDKRDQTGFLFGLFLVLLWTVRFFVEFVKEAQVDERATWALNTGQWLSVPFVLLGLYFMFMYKPKNAVK